VDAAVAPVRVLLGQAQNQHANRPDAARLARAFRPGHRRVVSAEQVAVLAQDPIRAGQQTESAQDLAW
jgi:hypothetical protein